MKKRKKTKQRKKRIMSINKTIYYIPIRERKKERKKENESEKPRKPGTFFISSMQKRERKKERKKSDPYRCHTKPFLFLHQKP